MRLRVSLILTAALVCLPNAFAKAKTRDYSAGTFLKIEERQPTYRYIGQPSDAPLTADTHTYEVSVQQGCTVYVGQWDSATDDFMDDLKPNSPVQVEVRGHSMHMKYLGRDLDMALVGHDRVRSCETSRK